MAALDKYIDLAIGVTCCSYQLFIALQDCGVMLMKYM